MIYLTSVAIELSYYAICSWPMVWWEGHTRGLAIGTRAHIGRDDRVVPFLSIDQIAFDLHSKKNPLS
jgi:hypothetical protein